MAVSDAQTTQIVLGCGYFRYFLNIVFSLDYEY